MERGLSANTIEAYRRDLTQYLSFLDAEDPTARSVSLFLGELRAARLTSASVARKLAAVRGLHRYLVQEGLADEDPTAWIESPRRGEAIPKALTVEEVFRLLEAPDPATALGRRDRALLELLYATGSRVSEATGLDLSDIDLEDGTALVTGKGSRQRLVPLGRHAREAIEAYLPDRLALRRAGRDSGALLLSARGRRLTRQAIWQIVKKAARRAGVPGDAVSPHVLRHSAATHMVEGGADLRTVQELLGHASIRTTQVYTRVSPQHLLEVYVTSHPRSI